MDVYYFTEMPAEFPESEAEKFPSMRLTFPNTYFDAANHLIVGSPETVIKKLRSIKDRLGRGAAAGGAGRSDVAPDHHAVDRAPRP
jgi:hypothetical protein